MWWFRFKAYAVVIGFSQALGDTGEVDLPVSEATVADPVTGKKACRLCHICQFVDGSGDRAVGWNVNEGNDDGLAICIGLYGSQAA
jgi:hypothetical protein